MVQSFQEAVSRDVDGRPDTHDDYGAEDRPAPVADPRLGEQILRDVQNLGQPGEEEHRAEAQRLDPKDEFPPFGLHYCAFTLAL
jgi:hypothetical protein